MKKLLFITFLFFSISHSLHAGYEGKCDQYINIFKTNQTIDGVNISIPRAGSNSGALSDFYVKLREKQESILNQSNNFSALLLGDATINSECGKKTGIDITNEENIINMNESTRRKYLYCAVSQVLSGKSNKFERESDLLGEVIDEKSPYVTDCASAYERLILTHKKTIIEKRGIEQILQEKKTLQSSDIPGLDYDDNGMLIELSQGLDCGGLTAKSSKGVMTCIVDIRKLKSKLTLEADDDYFSSFGVMMEARVASIINGGLKFINFLTKLGSFGYSSFDTLPDFPYTFRDMFDKTTIYGMINMFTMPLYSLIILIFFLRKGLSREEDDYSIFLLKFGIIIGLTLFFGVLYGGLNLLISWFNTALLNAVSGLSLDSGITNDLIKETLSLQVFNTKGGINISFWALLFFVINLPLLVIISFIVYIRDMFLFFLSLIFFVSSSGLLLSSTQTTYGGKYVRKGGVFLTRMLYWSLSVYIGIVLHIIFLKLCTVFLISFRSIETSQMNFIEAIPTLGASTFVYFLIIIATIWLLVKKIIPGLFIVIQNFFQEYFFRNEEKTTLSSFTQGIANDWRDVKMSLSDTLENNAYVKPIKDYIQGSSFYREVDDFVNGEDSIIRETLNSKWGNRAVRLGGRALEFSTKMATGIGDLDEEKEMFKNTFLRAVGYKNLTDNSGITKTGVYNRKTFAIDSEIDEIQSEIKATDDEFRKQKLETYLKDLQIKRGALFSKYALPQIMDDLGKNLQIIHSKSDPKTLKEIKGQNDQIIKDIEKSTAFYIQEKLDPYIQDINNKISHLDINLLGEEKYDIAKTALEAHKINKYAEIKGPINSIKLEKYHGDLDILGKEREQLLSQLNSGTADTSVKKDLDKVNSEINTIELERKNILQELATFNFDIEEYKEKREINDVVDPSEYTISKQEQEKIDRDLRKIKERGDYTEESIDDFTIEEKLQDLKTINGRLLSFELEAHSMLLGQKEEYAEVKENPKLKEAIAQEKEKISLRRKEIVENIKEISENISKKRMDVYNSDLQKKFINELIEDNIALIGEYEQSSVSEEGATQTEVIDVDLVRGDSSDSNDEGMDLSLKNLNASNFEQKNKAFWAD